MSILNLATLVIVMAAYAAFAVAVLRRTVLKLKPRRARELVDQLCAGLGGQRPGAYAVGFHRLGLDLIEHLLVSFPAWLGAGLCAVLIINVGMDDSGAASHTVPVRGTWLRTSGHSTAYHVRVGSWASGPEIDVKVDKATYQRLQPGASVMVVTRKGRLGWEWLEEVRAADETK